MKPATALTQRTRLVLALAFMLAALLVMAGIWCIPYVFESSTLFYKFGFQKFLLRGGKVVGLTAAMLLFFQVVPVARLKYLDRIFALNRIYYVHRLNGMAIAVLALLHPFMILASENFIFFRFEKRYWPEWLGVGLLVVIAGIVLTANWRTALCWAYDAWLRFHRPVTLLAITAAAIHVLFVSETFGSGPPRILIFMVASLNLVLVIRIWWRRLYTAHTTYIVSHVTPTGGDAWAIDLKPHGTRKITHLPGQFAFIAPRSTRVPMEEHPFTIASSPSEPDHLQFVIRARGDWTGCIGHLQTGETVIVHGPFGLFSHLAYSEKNPLILIAGGIGITPMLSMLRYMADNNDSRRILLIWSNKTEASIVLPEDFKKLQHRLPHMKLIQALTRGDKNDHSKVIIGRLDQTKLDRLLEEYTRQSEVFVCGPPPMMTAVSRMMKTAGFSRTRIHTEKFQF
jgi:predicted ferric reductase